MNKTVSQCLKIMGPCLALWILPLALGLAGCTAEPPLIPGAAAFQKDVRLILDRLAPALAGPLSHNDVKAAEQAILSLYPNAGQEKDDFPFRLGVMSAEGILLTSLPPVQAIGSDFIKYQLVKETLENRRINQQVLYSPNGTTIYIVLAPVMLQDKCVGLVGLRLTAAQALKQWGINEQEFQAMTLN